MWLSSFIQYREKEKKCIEIDNWNNIIFLDPVKFKWLKFSNCEIMRTSKGKALTGVIQTCGAFSECVQGQGYLGHQCETLQCPTFPHALPAEGGRCSSPRARPAHVRRWVEGRLLCDRAQCPGPLAFYAIIRLCWTSAHPALLFLYLCFCFLFLFF